MVAARSPERRAVMPIQPWYRDDRDFVVLQAADLLAGDLRLSSEKNQIVALEGLCPKLKASEIFKAIDESAMLSFDAQIKQQTRPDH